MLLQNAKKFLKSCVSSDKKQAIEVFVRYCNFSNASAHKKRPDWFTRQACYQNLISSINNKSNVNLTFFLDTFYPMAETHFILQQDRYPVVQIKQGTEGSSFCYMLDYVLASRFSPDTIIYFLEDDYLHRQGWPDILREGIDLDEADYVTLYDHKDKYFTPEYKGLRSELFLTQHTHWRETPSTTNTYAMKYSILKRDYELHYEFSRGHKISLDHKKFCVLRSQGSLLISPIPGWSSHMEPEFMSPCLDWMHIQNTTILS
jgi:hypothetical protein